MKEKLDVMLEREGRLEVFNKCVEFLPIRAKMDLDGFGSLDIFAH